MLWFHRSLIVLSVLAVFALIALVGFVAWAIFIEIALQRGI